MLDFENYIKTQQAFDFDDDEKEKIYAELKAAFSKKCQENNTFSDEYKKYVANLDNINVMIEYGCRAEIYFTRIDFKTSYRTTESYKESTTYSGDLEISSSGTAKMTNVTKSDNWRSYKMDHNTDVTLNSTKNTPLCAATSSPPVRNVESPSNKYFKRPMDSKSIPQSLKDTFSTLNEKFIINLIQTTRNKYKSEIEEKIRKTYFNQPEKLDVYGIEDYRIDYINAYYGPCNFKISVPFEGETYTVDCPINFENYAQPVQEKGAFSEHFKEYEKINFKYGGRFAFVASFFSFFCVAFTLITALFCLFDAMAYHEISPIAGFWKILSKTPNGGFQFALLTFGYGIFPFGLMTIGSLCFPPPLSYSPSLDLKKNKKHLIIVATIGHFVRTIISLLLYIPVLLIWIFFLLY